MRVVKNESARADAELLKETRVNHLVETSSCFSTLAAEHIVPWGLCAEPWTIVLPVSADPTDPDFGPMSPAGLRDEGLIQTVSWLEWANERWKLVRKEGERADLWDRIDYLRQLSSRLAGGSSWSSTQHRVLVPFATFFDSGNWNYPLRSSGQNLLGMVQLTT